MIVTWRCGNAACCKRDTRAPLTKDAVRPVCSRCRGPTEPVGVQMVEGFFERTVPKPDWQAPCPDCAGQGWATFDRQCFACLGLGELPVVRLLSVETAYDPA